MADNPAPVLGAASEKGPKRPLNADAYAHHVHNGRLAVAVVDGTGSTPEVVEFAQLAAATAVRVAARRTPVWGVMAASDLNSDADGDGDGDGDPDGAIAVARAIPGHQRWWTAWAGDCAIYRVITDGAVQRVTHPLTHGTLLRTQGASEEEARRYDHALTHTIGRGPIDGVWALRIVSPLLVLASDGLVLPESTMAEILTEHANDPETCAHELLKAGRSGDDTTVVVAPHPDTLERG
ncbi:Serine/threonine protein phosphatase PrpC [Streptoalloteichus tenebrarius]|uniref:Serine/threonine protein phosphatase PrpC n=1 Tax=Streptoalloteichus tenebrarius (strain ATCC 17920 / DSM 40477 / JCM 4838 / CBS 697.72 / NBRC 16177 / NCIMB 11028 / NRRL B-12390 / A12253. 1 / ISP 5477) TaxID=1933 RepID=A0ABT1I451_STRSD|nr:protein phosphatase 2C domain-containing protein [Streptoalloteichus tenebrarius]MCP2262567.1 Serine/threonine protein phosphatase PrpC [Streptoalloteichus tenebrarius]BFF01841.1 hypothetical protein GCM10020241_35160 [Streptoalloteichus tenebrarius]